MNKTVAITGASSGIGWALALEYAKSGANLIAIGRNAERLQALKTEMEKLRTSPAQTFLTETCDVRELGQLEALAQKLSSIDVLIHSAGVSYPQFLEQIPAREVDSLLSKNLIAPIHLTRVMLPHFKKRKAGHIAFVGSIAGEVNILGYTIYGASKAGLFAFADSLRNEMVPYNVKVSIIHPPDTKTPMLEGEKKIRPEIVQKLSEGGGLLTPESVAKSLMKGMAKGRFKIFPDFTSCLLSSLFRKFPRLMRCYLDGKVRSLSQAK